MGKENLKVEEAQVVEESKNRDLLSAKPQETGVSLLDMDFANVDLSEDVNEVQDLELASQYWTPDEKGESKIVIFLGIQHREIFDEETGELTETLPTVKMAASIEGSLTQVNNSSKRLVGILNDNNFIPGMKFKITYLGKKKSTNTGHNYDDWSVKPVVRKR